MAPHHAANRPAPRSFHVAYESWVDSNLNQFLISTAPENSYDYVKVNTFKGMADDWSAQARTKIDPCDKYRIVFNAQVFDPSEATAPTQELLGRAQRATAALYYRFITDTDRLLK